MSTNTPRVAWAQEPMSGVTVVVDDEGSDTIARRVRQSSRDLYVKKEEIVETAPKEVKKISTAKSTKKKAKKAPKRALKKSSTDELSEMKAVT